MKDTNSTLAPALPRRLASMAYDTFLVLPLIMLSVALGLGLKSIVTGGATDASGASVLDISLVRFLSIATVITFFSAFWLKSGQTLGMQAWRIKLVSSDGKKLSIMQCVIRCLGAVFSAGCLGLGYWWCIVDPHRRYWHDYLSRTELVLLPAKTKE